jgi:hypothetical protein
MEGKQTTFTQTSMNLHAFFFFSTHWESLNTETCLATSIPNLSSNLNFFSCCFFFLHMSNNFQCQVLLGHGHFEPKLKIEFFLHCLHLPCNSWHQKLLGHGHFDLKLKLDLFIFFIFFYTRRTTLNTKSCFTMVVSNGCFKLEVSSNCVLVKLFSMSKITQPWSFWTWAQALYIF